MKNFLVFSLLLTAALAAICGDYATACKAHGPVYVKHTYRMFTSASTGKLDQIIQTENFYSTSNCAGNPFLLFQTVITPVFESGTTSYEQYEMHYMEIGMKVNDNTTFANNYFTCDKAYAIGSLIDVTTITCKQAQLPFTRVYADTVGDVFPQNRILLGTNKITIFGQEASFVTGSTCTERRVDVPDVNPTSKPSGTPTWVIVVGIILVAVVLIALVAYFVASKPKETCKRNLPVTKK